jgi:hypothetical protein
MQLADFAEVMPVDSQRYSQRQGTTVVENCPDQHRPVLKPFPSEHTEKHD